MKSKVFARESQWPKRFVSMRFCMVTTFYPPCHFGGDATFAQALARASVSEGHHVEVVHCSGACRLQGRKQPAAQVER
jgi:hypothetical protein